MQRESKTFGSSSYFAEFIDQTTMASFFVERNGDYAAPIAAGDVFGFLLAGTNGSQGGVFWILATSLLQNRLCRPASPNEAVRWRCWLGRSCRYLLREDFGQSALARGREAGRLETTASNRPNRYVPPPVTGRGIGQR